MRPSTTVVSSQDRPPKAVLRLEDLEVYQVARDFRKRMYGVARRLPDTEKYGLVSQIRRAALSLTNNIAEEHGRYHYLDNIRFVLISRGSLVELMDDINVCADENYIPSAEVVSLRQDADRLKQLINGYVRYLRDCKAGEHLKIHESPAEYGTQDERLDLE